MSHPDELPFSDFSARFRGDLRRRPIFWILSGPSLAKSRNAFREHVGLDPMFGTQNEIAGVQDILRPLGRPLDIWMNVKTQQDVVDWRMFVELLDNPDTGIILTPFAWMRHSFLMELEREFVIRRFHKVLTMDYEAQMAVARVRVNSSVNSLLHFLFWAHFLEVKGPIFLFGCDGVATDGQVEGYAVNDAFGTPDRKHLFYDHMDEDRTKLLLWEDTQGTNENWPVFQEWFARRGIRSVPVYNVGGAGYVKAFEMIEPKDIAAKVAACDAAFDPAARVTSTGDYWDRASLQANIAKYDYFCSQIPSVQILRRILPGIANSAAVMQETKDQTVEALNTIMKFLMRLDGR